MQAEGQGFEPPILQYKAAREGAAEVFEMQERREGVKDEGMGLRTGPERRGKKDMAR